MTGSFPEAELMNIRKRAWVTIGSHTATHPRLTSLRAAEVCRELLESRIRLSKLLAANVNLICFPFSTYDESTLEMSRATGYVQAFGSQTTPLQQSHDEFLIQRVRVDQTDWPIEFHLKLMNAYRMAFGVSKLKQQVQTALSRLGSAPASESFARYRGNAATDRYSDAPK